MQLFETKRRTPAINLAALIDILFLLIIFFVVSSRIIGESGVKLVLPYDKSKSSVTVEMPLLEMSAEGKLQIINAEVPLANIHDYATALKAMSSGRGMYSLEFSHYQDMPHAEQQKVISDYESSRIEE